MSTRDYPHLSLEYVPVRDLYLPDPPWRGLSRICLQCWLVERREACIKAYMAFSLSLN